jgi:LemA protein
MLTTFLFIVLAVLAFMVIYGIGLYNSLVRFRNQVKNSWSQIDVQLKRRHDLIPNLVETAKGYMKHERETLESITNARNLATGAQGPAEASKAESQLSNAMSNFFVVVENYPDLKASTNFLALQEELTSTENKIGFARQFYNDQVLGLNNRIQMFPSSILAGMFNFGEEVFFEIENAVERETPEVKF